MASRYPQTQIQTASGLSVLTWIDCTDRAEMDSYQPCTQVYGVCFNTAGDILIIDEAEDGGWKIPGGTPEAGESPEQTLARELMEEADVELNEFLPLGVQKVEEYLTGAARPRVFYQWRFSGRIARIHPQTPDPAKGRIHPRRFVPAGEINEVVKWGETGRALFAAAIMRMKSVF